MPVEGESERLTVGVVTVGKTETLSIAKPTLFQAPLTCLITHLSCTLGCPSAVAGSVHVLLTMLTEPVPVVLVGVKVF